MKLKGLKRRIVVGDVHGQLDSFKGILSNAGLIDEEENWTGRDAVLIQTGDLIDRGPCSLEAVDLLRRLQRQATSSGGKVVRLCGNHELMTLQDDFYYVNFDDPEHFASELKEEIIRGKLCASFTDGERLYTHAGLRSDVRKRIFREIDAERPELAGKKIDLFRLSERINNIFKKSVENDSLNGHSIFWVGPERGGDDPVGGIFWCDFSTFQPSREAWRIPQIFGHTPTRKNAIGTAHGLKLINVDAGMCRVYGGQNVYLEITSEADVVQYSKAGPSKEWRRVLLGKNL